MTTRRPVAVSLLLASLIGLGAAVAVAGQDVVGPRAATEAPADARYAIVLANWRVTSLEIRLDRVTGHCWLYERRDELWLPIPCEAFEEPDTLAPRFQIVGNNEELWLLDTASGRTWRYGRYPRLDSETFAWSDAPAGADVEGWHLIR
ncbi:MAG: hypothetical protein R3D98_08930 [Candidatus Krumholzibacteriia bacterium]